VRACLWPPHCHTTLFPGLLPYYFPTHSQERISTRSNFFLFLRFRHRHFVTSFFPPDLTIDLWWPITFISSEKSSSLVPLMITLRFRLLLRVDSFPFLFSHSYSPPPSLVCCFLAMFDQISWGNQTPPAWESAPGRLASLLRNCFLRWLMFPPYW